MLFPSQRKLRQRVVSEYKDDVKNVVKFLQNYAENNALVLPEGAAGHHDCSLQLLSSWETKKVTHVRTIGSQLDIIHSCEFGKLLCHLLSHNSQGLICV